MSWLKGFGMILLGSAYKRTIGAKSHAKAKFRDRARSDQGGFWTSAKNKVSPVNSYGTCFKCEGAGKVTLSCKPCNGTGTFKGSCRKCEGTGTFTIPAKTCLTCEGSGQVYGKPCRKCTGTGIFLPARDVPCAKCEGRGKFSSSCSKCGGSGNFNVTCKKCDGSGWHKF
jgi:DnaJ-class molecular chaperone